MKLQLHFELMDMCELTVTMEGQHASELIQRIYEAVKLIVSKENERIVKKKGDNQIQWDEI